MSEELLWFPGQHPGRETWPQVGCCRKDLEVVQFLRAVPALTSLREEAAPPVKGFYSISLVSIRHWGQHPPRSRHSGSRGLRRPRGGHQAWQRNPVLPSWKQGSAG